MASSYKVVMARREEISKCLAKSMTKAKDLSDQIGVPVTTIKNDLYWMRKNSQKWLSGHTLDGYIFETQQSIEQIRDIEEELQLMRQKKGITLDDKIKIMHELKDCINMRWFMQGDGPTYLNNKYKSQYGTP